MNIRRATVADIAAIRRMADKAFRHTYRDILTPGQMEYMMEWMYSVESLQRQMTVEGHMYDILTTDADGDVGYVAYNRESAEADGSVLFHLQKIYVLPEHQGKGLGAVLLERAETMMRQLADGHPARYELNVNRNNSAVTFYERMGLHKDREGDFDIGDGYYMNDYIMAKDL